MDELDASEVSDQRNTQHELWLTMQAAYSDYKRTSGVLEAMVSSRSGDVSASDEALSVKLATDKQRAAFENYIESRLRFSEVLHDEGRGAGPIGDVSAARHKRPPFPAFRLAMAAMVAALFGATALSATYLARVYGKVRDLNASRNELTAALGQTRDGIIAIVGKMDALKSNQQSPYPLPVKTPQVGNWRPAPLAGQQKQTLPPRAPMGRPRTSLLGTLHSIGVDQNGRVAKSQRSLARLEKPGRRDYQNFTLTVSGQFIRVGPIRLSLLLSNPTHKSFDLCFVADDFKLYKKHGSLYEPVRINLSDPPRSVELVVSNIDRNGVQGYMTVLKSQKPALTTSQIRRRGPGGS
jgi:hypothetical protein